MKFGVKYGKTCIDVLQLYLLDYLIPLSYIMTMFLITVFDLTSILADTNINTSVLLWFPFTWD